MEFTKNELAEQELNGLSEQEQEQEQQEENSNSGKKNSPRRSRCFALITYIPIEQVEKFLKSQPFIQHYAFILHDKDKLKNKETGEIELKKKHTHVILYTFNSKTSSAMRKIFDRFAKTLVNNDETPENTLCKYCDDTVTMWRYLIHQDETDEYKHHYETFERKADDFTYWHKLENTNSLNDCVKNNALSMVNDMIKGFSHRDMLTKYGHYYLMYRKSARDVALSICHEENIDTKMFSLTHKPIDYQFMRVLTNSSNFSPDEVAHFFMVLNFIQKECSLTYNSILDFYLTEKE